jgi:D-serine deaminase-like pyridoxal phosphate-dependent protein
MNIEKILDTILLPATKGLPDISSQQLKLGDIKSLQWNLLKGDLPLPVATIDNRALENNSRWMREFTKAQNIKLAPHGKTTMAPQLYDIQLRDGAWGITVATVQQLKVCRQFGIQRIMMANQLVGRNEIDWVMNEIQSDPDFDFYCIVDSRENAQQLAAAAKARSLSRPVQLLVEGGIMHGRTGCRDASSAMELARLIKDCSPYLALRGVEGFEGVIKGENANIIHDKVKVFLEFLTGIVCTCRNEALFAPGPILFTAGGSMYFDIVANHTQHPLLHEHCDVILRSGCYLTHDSKMLTDGFKNMHKRNPSTTVFEAGLQPALRVWAYIQSIPEKDLAIATVGKRDISFDIDLPVPQLLFQPGIDTVPRTLGDEYQVRELNDQHAYLNIPNDSPIRVGDMVGFGISHPCTTFDKWKLLYLVDEHYNVEEGILTFF